MGEITKFPGKTQQEIKDSVNIQELKQFLYNLDQNISHFGGILLKGKEEVFVPENALILCFNSTTMMPILHKPVNPRELLTLAKWCSDQLTILEEETRKLEEQEKQRVKDNEDEM